MYPHTRNRYSPMRYCRRGKWLVWRVSWIKKEH